MRVIDGQKLADAILRLLDHEDGLRCAVAFWGPAMAKRSRERGATVILDLAMRGTTRNALSAFGVTPVPMPDGTGDRVRVLDWMHAKLYLGRDVAFIGSANASGNALGRNAGKPKLWEAGVVIRRDKEPRAYGKAEALWKSCCRHRGRSTPTTSNMPRSSPRRKQRAIVACDRMLRPDRFSPR